jgi:lipoate-protein ligase A
MKFLILASKNPYLNLAIEEYLFAETDDEIFMLWQNEPTVVIGRNQNAYAEINMNYVKENNIHIARRITGGGAVYHDLGNINYTFIANKESNGIDFVYFTEPILEALKKLNINAKLSGRNDLLVDDKKISGNAQFNKGNRVLHHGTLLFDTNIDVLCQVLKVDEEKIKSKAIKSVRSRVANLKSLLNEEMNSDDFISAISRHIINKYNPTVIETPQCEKIDILAKRNVSNEWLFPKNNFIADYTLVKKKKYNFGLLEMNINMSDEKIMDIKISGDFFGGKDISDIEHILKNTPLSKLNEILSDINIEEYICGMKREVFISHILM